MNKLTSKTLTALLILLTSAVAFAQDPQVNALTFQSWKDQQVLEAQNQMLRVSARISQLRSGKPAPSEAKETASLPSSKLKKVSEGDLIAVAEKDLKRSQDSMEIANKLQFSDYINIYLPTLQDQPDAVAKLVEKLSKEELGEITKTLLRKSSKPVDTKRNAMAPALDALTASARAKTQ